MVRNLVEPSEISRRALLKHCPDGLDADLAEYLAGDVARDTIFHKMITVLTRYRPIVLELI